MIPVYTINGAPLTDFDGLEDSIPKYFLTDGTTLPTIAASNGGSYKSDFTGSALSKTRGNLSSYITLVIAVSTFGNEADWDNNRRNAQLVRSFFYEDENGLIVRYHPGVADASPGGLFYGARARIVDSSWSDSSQAEFSYLKVLLEVPQGYLASGWSRTPLTFASGVATVPAAGESYFQNKDWILEGSLTGEVSSLTVELEAGTAPKRTITVPLDAPVMDPEFLYTAIDGMLYLTSGSETVIDFDVFLAANETEDSLSALRSAAPSMASIIASSNLTGPPLNSATSSLKVTFVSDGTPGPSTLFTRRIFA